jgi:hypothetical protein
LNFPYIAFVVNSALSDCTPLANYMKIIDSLKKVGINFPIGDYKDAAYKLLAALKLRLLEMKKWLK